MPHQLQRTVTCITAIIFLGFTPALIETNATVVPCQDSGQRDSPQDEQASLFMQAKLSNAQKVLGGLVSRDFDQIATGARQMKKIAEAAHWPTTIDEVYQHHSHQFRSQCDKLVEHAQANDLRAAHYTYLQLSTTCIDCHDYVRPRFKTQKQANGPIQLIPTHWDRPTRRIERPSPDDGTTILRRGYETITAQQDKR